MNVTGKASLVKMGSFVSYSCKENIIQEAGLHPLLHILCLIFGVNGTLGETSRSIKRIGFTLPVTA